MTPEEKPWSNQRPASPAAATSPTVYVPGEAFMPPGISHELSFEMAYDRQLDVSDAEQMSVGLLKADDQMLHSHASVKESDIDSRPTTAGASEVSEDNIKVFLKKPTHSEKRHFSPDAPMIKDHLFNTINGISD